MKERPQRLLIIEGNYLAGKEMAKKMEKQGFVVKVVDTIWQGLEVLESNSDYNFILANLNQNSQVLRQLACGKAR